MTLSHFLFNHPNKIKKDKILLDFVILHIFFVHYTTLSWPPAFPQTFHVSDSNRIRGFLVGALFQGEGIQRKGSIALVSETGETFMGKLDTRMHQNVDKNG